MLRSKVKQEWGDGGVGETGYQISLRGLMKTSLKRLYLSKNLRRSLLRNENSKEWDMHVQRPWDRTLMPPRIRKDTCVNRREIDRIRGWQGNRMVVERTGREGILGLIIMCEIWNHWRVLSRATTWPDVFLRFTQLVFWEGNHKGAKTETWSYMGIQTRNDCGLK